MEPFSRKTILKLIKNKISKDIGLLHHVKQAFDKHSLKITYISYIHFPLICSHIAWQALTRKN